MVFFFFSPISAVSYVQQIPQIPGGFLAWARQGGGETHKKKITGFEQWGKNKEKHRQGKKKRGSFEVNFPVC